MRLMELSSKGIGPTTPSTDGTGTRVAIFRLPGRVSSLARLCCCWRLVHPTSYCPEGRGRTDLMVPMASEMAWVRAHGPSFDNRVEPPGRSLMTTGWSTKAGAEPTGFGL